MNINRKHFHSFNAQIVCDMKCFVGVAWFNARFTHSVTKLLGTDYKLALCVMGGFLVSNFIRVIVLILFPAPNFYPVFTAS